MSDFTDYTETEFGDWIFRGDETSDPPNGLYLALHHSDPGNNPDGGTEVDESDYERYGTSFGNWNRISSGDPVEFEHDSTITFDSEEGWGEITHVSLWDGPSITDNPLIAGPLDSSVNVLEGETLRFRSGDITFEIN